MKVPQVGITVWCIRIITNQQRAGCTDMAGSCGFALSSPCHWNWGNAQPDIAPQLINKRRRLNTINPFQVVWSPFDQKHLESNVGLWLCFLQSQTTERWAPNRTLGPSGSLPFVMDPLPCYALLVAGRIEPKFIANSAVNFRRFSHCVHGKIYSGSQRFNQQI